MLFGVLRSSEPTAQHDLLELQLRSKQHRFVDIAHTSVQPDGEYRFPRLHFVRSGLFRVLDTDTGQISPVVSVRLVPVLPRRTGIRSAARFLASRAATDAFAGIDDYGRLFGVNVHRRFHSASVVKSMLLAAYLRMLASQHRPIDRGAKALLYPMIHSSDNGAASAVLAIVGEQRLDGVARAAGMTDYVPAGATWGFTEVSAADLARFFYRLGSVIPPRFLAYASWLLSTIEPSESWGIPAVARPRYRVLFKGGWLPEIEGLVNQVARLERDGGVVSLAVLTRGDRSMLYGEQTIEGVTARLLE